MPGLCLYGTPSPLPHGDQNDARSLWLVKNAELEKSAAMGKDLVSWMVIQLFPALSR